MYLFCSKAKTPGSILERGGSSDIPPLQVAGNHQKRLQREYVEAQKPCYSISTGQESRAQRHARKMREQAPVEAFSGPSQDEDPIPALLMGDA